MTYEKYVTTAQKMQRQYIADELKRNEKLFKLWREYQTKASKLGFHALDRSEIVARKDELHGMAARVEETHGDSPSMRSLWQMHEAEGRVT